MPFSRSRDDAISTHSVALTVVSTPAPISQGSIEICKARHTHVEVGYCESGLNGGEGTVDNKQEGKNETSEGKSTEFLSASLEEATT